MTKRLRTPRVRRHGPGSSVFFARGHRGEKSAPACAHPKGGLCAALSSPRDDHPAALLPSRGPGRLQPPGIRSDAANQRPDRPGNCTSTGAFQSIFKKNGRPHETHSAIYQTALEIVYGDHLALVVDVTGALIISTFAARCSTWALPAPLLKCCSARGQRWRRLPSSPASARF